MTNSLLGLVGLENEGGPADQLSIISQGGRRSLSGSLFSNLIDFIRVIESLVYWIGKISRKT